MLKTKTPLAATIYWIPLAIAITGLSLLVYGAVQQDLRQGANDPQIQYAQDLASQASSSGSIESFVPQSKVDPSKSLDPFVITFSDSGKVTASSVELDGKTPSLPTGVLDFARKNSEDRLTWQPKPGVRIAAVVRNLAGSEKGFVLVGRSLREVEVREDRLLLEVALAWLVTLGGSLFATIVLMKLKSKFN